MANLILLRHLLSQWNEEDRFNGWVDTPLAEGQGERARELADKISQFNIEKIYCARLFRNMATVASILEHDKKYPLFIHLDEGKMRKWGNFKDLSEEDIPVYVTENLNERYYGELQGENKESAMEKYGQEKVRLWRRGYKEKPPKGESLEDVLKRVAPVFKKYIGKDLGAGRNVLVVASHNSLRALIKHIENISDKDIINLEIPYGGLIAYELDDSLAVKNKKSF